MRRLGAATIATAIALLTWCGSAQALPTSFEGVGGTNASGAAHNAMNAFLAALGGSNNGAAAGPHASGFRAINWDAVPESLSTPNHFPPAFFNSTSPRGAVLLAPSGHFEVSAASGTGVGFGNFNATYPADFPAFSPPRVFSPVLGNVTEVTFYVPGTAARASVRGFGAIFRNVEVPNTTNVDFLDSAGNSLGKFFVPTSPTQGAPEFLGVLFSPSETVPARVRITTGTTALGPNDNPPATNVVVMDDFAYAEPQAIPGPALSVATPDDGATVTEPALTVSGAVSDAAGVLALTVDGAGVPVSSTGSWSAQVALARGANTIDVVATSLSGAVTEVKRTVYLAAQSTSAPNLPPKECAVPKLRGKTLAKARRALAAAHCKLGKVRRRQVRGKPGRVIAQKPKPGAKLPSDSAVQVTVGKR